jgi:hypothetical protein
MTRTNTRRQADNPANPQPVQLSKEKDAYIDTFRHTEIEPSASNYVAAGFASPWQPSVTVLLGIVVAIVSVVCSTQPTQVLDFRHDIEQAIVEIQAELKQLKKLNDKVQENLQKVIDPKLQAIEDQHASDMETFNGRLQGLSGKLQELEDARLCCGPVCTSTFKFKHR